MKRSSVTRPSARGAAGITWFCPGTRSRPYCRGVCGPCPGSTRAAHSLCAGCVRAPAGLHKAEQAEAVLCRKVPRAGVSLGEPHGRRAPQHQPRCPRAALRAPGPRPTRCSSERRIPLRATRRSFGTDCQQPSEPRSCWFGSESPVWFINL